MRPASRTLLNVIGLHPSPGRTTPPQAAIGPGHRMGLGRSRRRSRAVLVTAWLTAGLQRQLSWGWGGLASTSGNLLMGRLWGDDVGPCGESRGGLLPPSASRHRSATDGHGNRVRVQPTGPNPEMLDAPDHEGVRKTTWPGGDTRGSQQRLSCLVPFVNRAVRYGKPRTGAL